MKFATKTEQDWTMIDFQLFKKCMMKFEVSKSEKRVKFLYNRTAFNCLLNEFFV